MRRFSLAVLCLLLPVLGAAQDLPTSYEFRVYAVGAASPQFSTPFPLSAANCNVTATVPAGAAVNPTVVVWDDPQNPGKKCQWDGSGATLIALPIGSYVGALVAVNAGGSSAESARDPFSRQAMAPAAPTGVRLSRPAP